MLRTKRSRLSRGGWPRYSRRHSARSCGAVRSFRAASFCSLFKKMTNEIIDVQALRDHNDGVLDLVFLEVALGALKLFCDVKGHSCDESG